MLVAILSDSHDHVDRLKQAMQILSERGITTVIHAGDFVAPFALAPIVSAGVKFFAVFGNNDGEIAGLKRASAPIGEIQAPPYRFELDGKRFLLTHAPLPETRIAVEKYQTDYLVYGHTHLPEKKEVGSLTLINPGELGGWLKRRATIAILDTATGMCEFVDLK